MDIVRKCGKIIHLQVLGALPAKCLAGSDPWVEPAWLLSQSLDVEALGGPSAWSLSLDLEIGDLVAELSWFLRL